MSDLSGWQARAGKYLDSAINVIMPSPLGQLIAGYANMDIITNGDKANATNRLNVVTDQWTEKQKQIPSNLKNNK